MRFIRKNAFNIFIILIVFVLILFVIAYCRAHKDKNTEDVTINQQGASYESEYSEITTYPITSYTNTETTSEKSITTQRETQKEGEGKESTVSTKRYYDIPVSDDDQDFINKACKYYSFDNEILYKMMSVESDYDRHSVSRTNDHGIMQLNYKYYKEYVKNGDDYDKYTDDFDIYDIRQNVTVALREISFWRRECSKRGYYDYHSILECYNKGYTYFTRLTSGYYNHVMSVNISYR